MTNKELAVEYRKSLKQKFIDEDEFERLEMFDKNVEEAYLAGLKAGKDMAEADLATIAYMQGAARHNKVAQPYERPE